MLAHSPIPATVCDNMHNGAFSAAPEQLRPDVFLTPHCHMAVTVEVLNPALNRQVNY